MQLEDIDAVRHRIPRHRAAGMRTDVVVYASRRLLDQISKDASLQQAVNVSMLPGIIGPSLAMPDIHQGYGFPIGGVAATDWRTGVVSPGGVGFDINRGVRLVDRHWSGRSPAEMKPLIDEVFRDVPCGTGGEGPIHLQTCELDGVLERGAQWVVDQGFGQQRTPPGWRAKSRGCARWR